MGSTIIANTQTSLQLLTASAILSLVALSQTIVSYIRSGRHAVIEVSHKVHQLQEKRVLKRAATARAHQQQHELEQEVAQSDSSAQRSRTEWRRNQAVPAGRLSEERYAKKQDKYFEQLDGKVLACLGLVRGAWQARVRA